LDKKAWKATYALKKAPCAGWWAFYGLNLEKNARHHEGKKVNVEYGPVLWVQFTEWPAAAPAPAATK
jgi:hypothetical protein